MSMAAVCLTTLLSLQQPPDLFRRENLVAWCIVPFDAQNRGPAQRVAMLKRLGFSRFAYDWRDAHLPSFGDELGELKKSGISLQGLWFPPTLNKNGRFLLEVLQQQKVTTDLWISLPDPAGSSNAEKTKSAVAALGPLLSAAADAHCTISLYNHGGWMGEPDNQLAILREVNSPLLGIVYNLHHGHDHLSKFPEVLRKLMPRLRCLNLNGMNKEGDRHGQKILPLGAGAEDLAILRLIKASGYNGPFGILGHTHGDDVQDRLRDNLDGLNWLTLRLAGAGNPAPPQFRTHPPKK